MASILSFAGSNSSTSVNYKLVKYTVSIINGHDIKLLNMVNFPFPMFSVDYEKENGYSNSLVEFKDYFVESQALILSVNEHNGNPSAYFKNVIDWLSRLDRNFLVDTKVLLMSTSPGKRGGIGAHDVIKNVLPRFGADIVSTFSLPSFNSNFDEEKGILNPDLSKLHKEAIENFLAEI